MRRRGDDGGGRRGARGGAAAPQSAGQKLLAEGARLQQQAERNKEPGASAALLAQAAEKYRGALGHGSLGGEERADAAFGLGECLQKWAEAHVAAARAAPLAPDSLTAEAAAAAAAATACAQSLDAYAAVRGDDGAPREDALVNSGNVLASWAELAAPSAPAEAASLLARACASYEAASAAADPEAAADVELLRGWADALVRRGELAARGGDAPAAAALYDRALGAYAAACGAADSTRGDDLSGLLYNWGCGLQSRAEHLPATAAQDLELAAVKLRSAAEFGAGDAEPLNALGDVLQAAAELAAAAAAAGGGPAAAVPLLQRALDEGYLRALRLSRGNADAQVGVAEVRLALARAAAAAGDAPASAASAAAAADAYAAALAQPRELGTVAERLDVQYNFACAAAQCGRMDAALAALNQVLACGGTTPAEAEADPDLAPLRAALQART